MLVQMAYQKYKSFHNIHEQHLVLRIFIDEDNADLKAVYTEAATKHNAKMLEDPYFYDAGFDLFLPENNNTFLSNGIVNKVDFKVKCSATLYATDGARERPSPFYMYARSSLSKTPLRLANNQGIIDAGYRGNLIGMFDCIYSTNKAGEEPKEYDYYVDTNTRLVQICAPGLIPILVFIANSLEELGPNTSRGDGGFGSTGK
jgi:dUTP pyrophosphatase